MRRRGFITLLSGAAAWPLAAWAQPGKLPTIGFLGGGTLSTLGHLVTAFVQRLRELGWIEGALSRSNIAGPREAPSASLISRPSSFGSRSPSLSRKETRQPLRQSRRHRSSQSSSRWRGTRLAAASSRVLARPGGNVTGLSVQATDLAGKRLELLREVLPGFRRLAIMANGGNPAAVLQMGEAQAAALMLSLEVATLDIRRVEDIAPAFEAIKDRAEALYVVTDTLALTNRVRINTLAAAARLPTIYNFREPVEAGGLMSYGPNFPDLFRRAADYVDKILRGAMPGNIPVEQPTKFDLVINLTTAKALGLAVPRMLLARADEVIE